MTITKYTYTQEVNPKQLESEIKASAIVTHLSHITYTDELFVLGIFMDDALSAGDETILNDLVTNHVLPPSISSLDQCKMSACAAIDARTSELIDEGFTYDSVQFSLSELAQINWIGLKISEQNAILTYPFDVSTKDDGEYSLPDAQAIQDFFATGVGVKIGHIQSGRALKVSVKNAVDEAAVDAVIDNR